MPRRLVIDDEEGVRDARAIRRVRPGGTRHRGTAEVVAALRRPESYGGGGRVVGVVETHMSWVFLTERHAYKLKKPMRTVNFDHTTLGARERACRVELELNRRLARTVYLAVVPVVASDGGMRVEAEGDPVEWLVKMRRLPRALMLDACIERRTASEQDVDRLAETLVRFYAEADPHPESGPAYRERVLRDIEATAASLTRPHYGLRRSDIEAVLTLQRRWADGHPELLGARAEHVVDAHGDLRPEHVCLEPDPVVIDCLEFSQALRLLDPLSELSFLALECRRLGAPWIGERLVGAYLEAAGERASAGLLAFYQREHAIVRAAIAVWHLDDDALEHTDSWPQRATAYLRLAREAV